MRRDSRDNETSSNAGGSRPHTGAQARIERSHRLFMVHMPALGQPPAAWAGVPMRVGLDLVDIRRMRESIDRFGDRLMQRLFSAQEIAYAKAQDAQTAERLAARFAAKEAAVKAFSLSEVGAGWRDIEVRRHQDGACSLELRGRAAQAAQRLGVTHIALSLSHDGDYAGAVVTALCDVAPAMARSPHCHERSFAS
jgi:holo-[acyl-carrier protein] synthase